MNRAMALACMLGCLFSYASAQDNDHHHHGAHVHGHAQMNMVMENNQLFIELISPMDNLVGFEHAPRSPEEKLAWAEARAYLEKTEELFEFEGGDCEGGATELRDPVAEHSKGNGHHHKDLEVTWLYRCKNTMPRALLVNALQHFSGIMRLEVNWITEKGQGAQVLTPEHIRVGLQ